MSKPTPLVECQECGGTGKEMQPVIIRGERMLLRTANRCAKCCGLGWHEPKHDRVTR